MPLPRPVAALILLATVGAAIWLARDESVTRYYMPGAIGEQIVRGQKAEKLKTEKLTSDFSGSAFQRFSVLPPFLTRHIGLRAGVEQQWGTRNGLTAGIPFSHNLNHVFPPALYDAHPEFFPLVGGQRFRPAKGSYHWNPDLGRKDVAAYAAGVARKHFEQQPGAVSFSLGINDALLFGESPETLEHVRPPRWFRGRPDYTNLVYTFMNRAAEDLSRTHPGQYLGALAYYWAENAPTFRVHPQVIPFLTADRAQSYDPVFKAEELELQKRWARAVGLHPTAFEIGDLKFEIPDPSQISNLKFRIPQGSALASGPPAPSDSAVPPSQISNLKSQIPTRPRLGLYDYLDGYGFLIPRVPIRAFAEHLRHARSVGFTDYYGEANLNWGVTGPLHWVIAQVLSHPDADVEALLNEYYREYFREAAEPMRRFFERCEEVWMQQSGPSYWLKYYRSEAQADLFPSAVCVELRGLLDDAGRLAKSDAVQQRVKFVSDSFGLTERYVAFQEARVALTEATLEDRGQDAKAGGTPALPGQSQISNLKSQITASSSLPVSGSADRLSTVPRPLSTGSADSASDLSTLSSQLSTFLSLRSEFIRYSLELARTQPLAFYRINHDDWLRNDPTFAAARRLIREHQGRDLARESRDSSAHDAPRLPLVLSNEATRSEPTPRGLARESKDQPVSDVLASLAHYPAVAAALAVADAPADAFTERLTTGDLSGPVQRGQRIAGLQYGIDLPAPWQSRVEPTEHGVHELREAEQAEKLKSEMLKTEEAGGTPPLPERAQISRESAQVSGLLAPPKRSGEGGSATDSAVPPSQISNLKSQIPPQACRTLRISGAETSTVYQWLPAKAGALYVASVQVRGRVSSTNATMLTLGWLDAKYQPIGKPVVMRMPDTETESRRAAGPVDSGQGTVDSRRTEDRGRLALPKRLGGGGMTDGGGTAENAEKLKTETLKSADAGGTPALPGQSPAQPELRPSGPPALRSSTWMLLEQAQRAPANAAWVGIGVRIQHQLPGDWSEFKEFSLQEGRAPDSPNAQTLQGN